MSPIVVSQSSIAGNLMNRNHGETVLVVEDELLARRSLARLLRRQGYFVRVAASGKRAVNIVRSGGVGVILMDISLPGRCDGIEAAEQIQRVAPETEIVFVSAFLDRAAEKKIADLGVRSIRSFSKPLAPDLDSLYGMLGQLLRGRVESTERQDIGIRIEPIGIELYQAIEAHPELLRTLHWRKFECLMAELLETFGYRVELCRGTKDGGIDIFALERSAEWGSNLYILQAKRWHGRVGVEPVQRLLFLHQEHRATKSCLVTTSTFSSGARRLGGQYRWQLRLCDYEDLRSWVERARGLKVSGTR